MTIFLGQRVYAFSFLTLVNEHALELSCFNCTTLDVFVSSRHRLRVARSSLIKAVVYSYLKWRLIGQLRYAVVSVEIFQFQWG